MGLAGRRKVGVDAGVELDGVQLEPHTTTGLQALGFRYLSESKNTYVELTSSVFATGGNRNLDVVDPLQRIPLNTVTTLPISSTPSVNTIGS